MSFNGSFLDSMAVFPTGRSNMNNLEYVNSVSFLEGFSSESLIDTIMKVFYVVTIMSLP